MLHKIDNIIAFADDVVIYHSDSSITNINTNLQSKYNTVEEYTIDWQLKVNANKCETVLFRPPIKNATQTLKKIGKSSKLFRTNRIS